QLGGRALTRIHSKETSGLERAMIPPVREKGINVTPDRLGSADRIAPQITRDLGVEHHESGGIIGVRENQGSPRHVVENVCERSGSYDGPLLQWQKSKVRMPCVEIRPKLNAVRA